MSNEPYRTPGIVAVERVCKVCERPMTLRFDNKLPEHTTPWGTRCPKSGTMEWV